MAKKPKMVLPQSTAGLVRYFDEDESALKLTPEQTIALSIGLILLVIILGHILS